MSKFNPRPPRCPSAPVLTQSRGGSTYAPAGGVAGQRRFMLHGFRAGSRFDVDTGLGWDDVTEGDGSGPVPGGWLTRTANLPATPFRIRVRLADGTYLQWDRVDPAAGDPIHINVDATGPDPVIPWTVGSEGNASGARSFQLALERIPPGTRVAVRAPNGEERVSTFTLVDAATPVQLNYTDMRVTREADAMTTTGGMGSIVVSGVPAAIMADSVTAIHSTPAGDIGAQFVPHQFMPGAFVAQNVAAGDWRVSVMVRGALVGRPGSGYGVGPDIRSATVTVRPNETVQVNFASMTAPTGIPVTDPNDRGMVVAGSVPLTITAPDTFLVTVDGATVSPNLIQSSGNPGLIDGRYVAPTGAFTQRQAMVAPGVHRVAVRDPSAAACYSDTQDITVASGVPASMDYTAPITSALQACAARQSVATGGWAGLSAPAKMGVVGVGLAAVGGAIWWWADSAKSSRSSRDDSDEE